MKKILPVAVLAAIAGVNGAQAVHVNDDGTGQVLLYPYYTVEGGQDTLINLVNTTDDYKAVKIRILESMNSREVLDFNIYMSPRDHWSAAITADGDGAKIRSVDNTCTVPRAISEGVAVPFRTFEYDGSFPGSQPDYKPGTVPLEDSDGDVILDENGNEVGEKWGVERTREGYVEVIEMGVVTDTTIQGYIEHGTDGIPGDCVKLANLWDPDETPTYLPPASPNLAGVWTTNGAGPGYGIEGQLGGLYGYGIIIDVPRATDATYDAVALDNWKYPGRAGDHSSPGSLNPYIGDGTFEYALFDEGGVIEGATEFTALEGLDAVSAVLMQASIDNDYVLEPSVDAGTDWVVTFPTKREYVNDAISNLERPFTNEWNYELSVACETFEIDYWDREEGVPSPDDNDVDFSPLPPPGEVQTSSFCHEANVLTFNESNVLAASDRTGVNIDLAEGFNNGWAEVDLTRAKDSQGNFETRILPTLNHDFFGLPAVGFAVQRYLREDGSNDGVVSNYAGSVLHKGDREITSFLP